MNQSMPPDHAADAYLRTRVLSAPPEQLRLMLLDGALRFGRQARDGLVARNYESSYAGFTRCRAVLLELLSGMRPEVDAELCARVSGLYTYMITRLMEASHGRSVEAVDEVLKLLEYERDTWAMLIDKLAAESRTTHEPPPALAHAGPPVHAGTISVSG